MGCLVSTFCLCVCFLIFRDKFVTSSPWVPISTNFEYESKNVSETFVSTKLSVQDLTFKTQWCRLPYHLDALSSFYKNICQRWYFRKHVLQTCNTNHSRHEWVILNLPLASRIWAYEPCCSMEMSLHLPILREAHALGVHRNEAWRVPSLWPWARNIYA